MAEPSLTTSVILKILTGMQSGVEVSLSAGEYSLGTGSEDDIQLIDVSIMPGHARLRVSSGKIELAGAKGSLRSAAGLVFEPSGAWQEVEPLDIVTAGTTRLALGHATSQWASIVEYDGESTEPARAQPGGWQTGLLALSRTGLRTIVAPLVALLLVLALTAWLILGGGLAHIAGKTELSRNDLALTREALDQFPFGRTIEARQDVDGTVYVSGYVEAPVERRALTAAVEKTGVPARIRLSVLQNIRSEVENLITSQKAPVTFQVSPAGELTLDGLILSEDRAARLVDLIKERVIGLASIQSRIRTAATLLTEVEKLAVSTQVQPYVLLRVDNALIEATGAIPAQRIDAWVGFLQSYARRFARDIPLRSFVQLQNEGGTAAANHAVILGGTASGDDVALDVNRLNQGSYKLGEIFPGATSGARASNDGAGGPRVPSVLAEAVTANASRVNEAVAANASRVNEAIEDRGVNTGVAVSPRASDPTRSRGGRTDFGIAANEPQRPRAAGTADVLTVALPKSGSDGLVDRFRDLVDSWKRGNLDRDAKNLNLRNALETLRASDQNADGNAATIPSWYLPLLTNQNEEENVLACWPGTQIRARDALAALFWLDLMSTSEAASLSAFNRDQQLLILEVALNPMRSADCTRRSTETRKAADNSVYLREIRRNPSFVRFIVRDLPPFVLDITGAKLMDDRFIVLRTGRKLFEGSAPDPSSRVALIGELGVCVQLKSGLAAVVFEPDISWKITQ